MTHLIKATHVAKLQNPETRCPLWVKHYILGLRWLSLVGYTKLIQSSTGKDCNQLHQQKSQKWQLGWCGDMGFVFLNTEFLGHSQPCQTHLSPVATPPKSLFPVQWERLLPFLLKVPKAIIRQNGCEEVACTTVPVAAAACISNIIFSPLP